ncbi:MAG: GNAT family N-acetyltransferase [Actinomycetota bacterium]
MSTEYRLVTDGDYDHGAIVRIGRAIRSDDYVSVADIQDWEENQRRAGRFNGRWLASVSDEVVGSAYFGQSPWVESATMFTHVMVHPDHQQRGYGRTLLERLEVSAREHGARRLLGNVHESNRRSVRFVELAGFEEMDREWRSTLELAMFDPDAWRDLIDRIESAGICFISVEVLQETFPEWKRELHRLYVDIESDVPTPFDILEMPFEDFDSLSLGRRLLAEGFLVAMDGDTMIGLTEPQPVDDDPTAISQELTGVRADYRGRGIATALKAAAAIWAKEQGYTSMRTYNAQSNAAMLAVNTRLGYEREHGQIEYVKNL